MKWLKRICIVSIISLVALYAIYVYLNVFGEDIGEMVYGPGYDRITEINKLNGYFWFCWALLRLVFFMSALICCSIMLVRQIAKNNTRQVSAPLQVPVIAEEKKVSWTEKAITLKRLKLIFLTTIIAMLALFIVYLYLYESRTDIGQLIYGTGNDKEARVARFDSYFLYRMFLLRAVHFIIALITGATWLIKKANRITLYTDGKIFTTKRLREIFAASFISFITMSLTYAMACMNATRFGSRFWVYCLLLIVFFFLTALVTGITWLVKNKAKSN